MENSKVYSMTSVHKASHLHKCTILYWDWENWQRPTFWSLSFLDLAEIVCDSTCWSSTIPFIFTYFSRSWRRHRNALLLNSNFKMSDLPPGQDQPEPRACRFRVVSPILWNAPTRNSFETAFSIRDQFDRMNRNNLRGQRSLQPEQETLKLL